VKIFFCTQLSLNYFNSRYNFVISKFLLSFCLLYLNLIKMVISIKISNVLFVFQYFWATIQ
jgi:hypothetical protein